MKRIGSSREIRSQSVGEHEKSTGRSKLHEIETLKIENQELSDRRNELQTEIASLDNRNTDYRQGDHTTLLVPADQGDKPNYESQLARESHTICLT